MLRSVRQSSSKMVFSCSPHPHCLSQQLFSEPAPKISPCSKNKLYLPTPIPVLLTHSFFPFLCCFISESLNYFLESDAISRKGCESIFPHARLVSNLVISTVYVRDLSGQTFRKRMEKHPDIPLVLKLKGKGRKQVSCTLLAMFFNKHDSCHAVL